MKTKQLLFLCFMFIFAGHAATAQTRYSLQMDGIDDYMEINNIQQTTQFSVMIWFKFKSYGTDQLIVQHKNTCIRGGGWLLGITSTGQLRYLVQDCGTCSVAPCSQYVDHSTLAQITLDTWYNVALTSDGISKQFVYLDGVPVDSITDGSSLVNYGNVPVLLAKWFDDTVLDYADADYADFIYFNKGLSQQEVQNYIDCPPNGNEPELTGFWNFTEGSGTTANDQTANTNNGTLYSGVAWSTDVPSYSCFTTGIQEFGDNNISQLYPNPAKNEVIIEGAVPSSIKVFNVFGQCVKAGHATNRVRINELPAGMYVFELTDEKNNITFDKIMKE